MAPHSSAQKQMIAQFVNLTGVNDSSAAKILRTNSWDVQSAINKYFEEESDSSTSTAISQLFDPYRDDPQENPDGIGIEGSMKYFGDLKVRLDEVTCLAIAELLKSPTMGEFTRENFVNGWTSVQADTLPKQINHAATLRTRIPTDPDLFRRVYRYTFLISRMAGQRNLPLEIACDHWQLFFTPDNGGIKWDTETTPWLQWWLEFMNERFKRPVNKDLWEQTEVLSRRTKEDETFGWHSDDGAWPGAIDDFVAFVREKRGENMDVE